MTTEPITGAVGLKAMVVATFVTPTGFAYVGMVCAVCGDRVCQYSTTDLDELNAEYGAHLAFRHPQKREGKDD